ncbi:zinc finger CCCH domain-containing protein 14-like [Uloborus diversus]|uniref:zinc finger CCCH domain-containing protein 14-like n=1 Tax=Uloborus diversus TaxID=327109 RepID=UPI002409F968|nr:zinc finger CCCH domain-containing protein 14-like [Uloborus diversus]
MEASLKVTDEIRAAIKRKLAEFDAFIDDELPEYIMILIANKRSREQINKHLSLFLGKDTVNFTLWLENLLQSLKATSKESSVTSKESVGETETDAKPNEDCDVLNYDPNEQGEELGCDESTNSSFSNAPSIKVNVDSKSVKTPLPEEPNVKEPRSRYGNQVQKRDALSESSHTGLSSAIVSVDNKSPFRISEYDPNKPDIVRSVSSVVRQAREKYKAANAIQTNKLLLKAVNDATKSILNGKDINDYYKPTPIKVLASKFNSNAVKSAPSSSALLNCNTEVDLISDVPVMLPFDTEENDLEESSEESVAQDEESSHSRTIYFTSTPQPSSSSNLRVPAFDANQYSMIEPDEEDTGQTHFYVTLEGVNIQSLKRKRDDDDDLIEDMEEDETVEENVTFKKIETAPVPEKKQKINEKCKYWPACKNSDQCLYHHPTIPCKCFPDCKFGDKCLYVHPNCKFDALCSRKDCPYTHISKRKLPAATLPVRMVSMKMKPVKAMCKFFPKCTSRNCPFVHPKPCRYGTDCRLPACVFSHFQIPSRNQLKWQAKT